MKRAAGMGRASAQGQSVPASPAQKVTLGGFSGEGVLERPGAIFNENALEEVCAAGPSHRRTRVIRSADGRGGVRVLSISMLLLGFLLSPAHPAAAQALPEGNAAEPHAVPAELVRLIGPPGSANGFLRPSTICFDRKAGELYVADSGNRRIVVFGQDGTYRFEFSEGLIAAPISIAVDSEGYLYLLVSTGEGKKVLVHDFDGTFVRDLKIASPADGPPLDPASIALDDEDNLYLLDDTSKRVCSFDRSGSIRSCFALFSDMDEKARGEIALGSIRIDGGLLLVPASTLGSVYVYGLDGGLRRIIGHQGSTPGELSFPVAAAITDSVLLVLDKHRFTVVCYDLAGRFLGEFGGRGASPGWFYHPTLLEVDREGDAYVGQIFLNRVQECRIPVFVLAGARQGAARGVQNASSGSSRAG